MPTARPKRPAETTTAAQVCAADERRAKLLLRVFWLQLVELAAELVTEGRTTGVGRVEALGFRCVLRPRGGLDRQADLALRTIGVEHLHLDRLARREDRAGVL